MNRRPKPEPINRLDYSFATIVRLKNFRGTVPWLKMLLLLALAKRPMRAKELAVLINDGVEISSPLAAAFHEGLVSRANGTYHLTGSGEEMVREILTPPLPQWQKEEE